MKKRGIRWLRRLAFEQEFSGGFDITSLTHKNNEPLNYTINDTMLRIDLPEPLLPGRRL